MNLAIGEHSSFSIINIQQFIMGTTTYNWYISQKRNVKAGNVKVSGIIVNSTF